MLNKVWISISHVEPEKQRIFAPVRRYTNISVARAFRRLRQRVALAIFVPFKRSGE